MYVQALALTSMLIGGVLEKITTAPTPLDAVTLAFTDVSSLPEEDRCFQRYIWNPTDSITAVKQNAYSVNLAVSKSTVLVKPRSVAGGQLVRWDLRLLAPRKDDIAKLIELWDGLASKDPYFHVHQINQKVTVDPYPADDGKTYDYKYVTGSAFGAHTNLTTAVMLQGLTKSNNPVMRYDWFEKQILSTIDGGKYYDFLGIERNPKGRTAQEAFLESLGIDEAKSQAIRADQRAAIFRSGVTGKPRRVDIFRGLGGRSGTGFVSITHDLADADVDPKVHPIRNLLDFKDTAREIIAERNNGLHAFALFNGKGELQDEVPPNIAVDRTIPAPHTMRLQSAISCIRCHGFDGSDGLKPFDNDVQKLLSNRLDVFGDVKSKEFTSDVLDRLAGLYAGDLRKPISRAKDDYAESIFKITEGMSVKEAADALGDSFSKYTYDMVSPEKAALELGFKVKKDDAAKLLQEVLPQLKADESGISPEDPIIGALKTGLSINRVEWEQIYADCAIRSMDSLAKLRGKK